MDRLEAALKTHPGLKRPKNEDAVGGEATPWGGVYVVADGMGGHRTGEVASRLAVETVLARLSREEPPSPKDLLEALEEANGRIHREAQRPENRGMGTTCTVLVLDLPYALVAHVAERVRQGLLSPEEARTHRWRNVITNALGSFPQARVDLLGLKLRPGDTFLLCTDGLSGVLEERALKEVLAHFPPAEAAERLVALANEWGGPDNVSVAVVRVPEALPERQRPYALPLEAAKGEPVRLQVGEVPEELSTQILEPAPKRGRVGWRDALLILLWVVVVAYILLNSLRTP